MENRANEHQPLQGCPLPRGNSQSTGKSSWQKGLSHKESEEKGEDEVTRTGLKWGRVLWQQQHLARDVNAMDR